MRVGDVTDNLLNKVDFIENTLRIPFEGSRTNYRQVHSYIKEYYEEAMQLDQLKDELCLEEYERD